MTGEPSGSKSTRVLRRLIRRSAKASDQVPVPGWQTQLGAG